MLLIFTPLGGTNPNTLISNPYYTFSYHWYANVINVYLHLEALIPKHRYPCLHSSMVSFSYILCLPLFSHTLHVLQFPLGLHGLSLKGGALSRSMPHIGGPT